MGLSPAGGGFGELLIQPSDWIPFTADFTLTMPNGKVHRGVFARAADGSHRMDMNAEAPGKVITTIYSASTRTVYIESPGAGWVSSPAPARPLPRWRRGTSGLRPYADKVALRAGDDGSLRSDKGFEAWLYTTKNGGLEVLVPDLNFFPVVSVDVAGHRELYYNIRVGPLPDDLFAPPPRAIVRPTVLTPAG